MLEINSSDTVSIIQLSNTQGFDGHCLRAAYYFKDELIAEGINIDITDPKSVNILKDIKHWSRQDSKAPTFLLT